MLQKLDTGTPMSTECKRISYRQNTLLSEKHIAHPANANLPAHSRLHFAFTSTHQTKQLSQLHHNLHAVIPILSHSDYRILNGYPMCCTVVCVGRPIQQCYGFSAISNALSIGGSELFLMCSRPDVNISDVL
ncbi:hypothetical protein CDAR_503761 [Caerostris darwini]|uniref:Uncharacterized protein n=1 Tax=Caerostris darwini TaxID=1538125 RepID=A0AAV4WTA8_9ARAC|nr:hypothetical protein CDAR_503761 [Caerostris darwini]